jgi:hypothetical protein
VSSRKIQEVSDAPTAYMLTADAMLMLFNGVSIFVWLGRHLPLELRSTAIAMADKLRFQNELPADVSVEVVKQGLEGPAFKDLFPDWRTVQEAALSAAKVLRAMGGNDQEVAEAAMTSSHAVDVLAMAQLQPEEPPPADVGSGERQVATCSGCAVTPRKPILFPPGHASTCVLLTSTYATPILADVLGQHVYY